MPCIIIEHQLILYTVEPILTDTQYSGHFGCKRPSKGQLHYNEQKALALICPLMERFYCALYGGEEVTELKELE